ncbi:hypothetical protein B566_EDAN011449 [Ephemera danica]|nr:hypothetical protein B566_EDAN011449 [Ephemera danica]
MHRLQYLVTSLVLPFFVSGQAKVPIEDKEFWYNEGRTTLHATLAKRLNLNVARNVILFVGDGMGISTVTAARIFREQRLGHLGEEGFLSWETFPDVGLVKTYNVDKQVPDSAATATALFTGVKTNFLTVGVDATSRYNVCDATVLQRATASSMIAWAQQSGKDTGIITTTRITHATPAAMYAHTQNREWECDSSIPPEYRGCVKDIARQLIEDEPGRNIKVILGGGLQQFSSLETPQNSSCRRQDGRNLTELWRADKIKRGAKANFVQTTEQLMALRPNDEDQFVLGLFNLGHMDYDAVRDRRPEGAPSIVNMTIKAIELLQKNDKGYLLVIEGGRIDHAHHDNMARLSLLETVQMDAAVTAALERTSREDTLIMVTADHSHTMTINGYPARGNDILGLAQINEGMPIYETLTYANGPGFDVHRKIGAIASDEYLWKKLETMDRKALNYRHFAPIKDSIETHDFISETALSKFSTFRAIMVTWAPRRAASNATHLPMPKEPPVT